MTDFLKIAKSIVVHFAHICAYGVETVKQDTYVIRQCFRTFNLAGSMVLAKLKRVGSY